MKEHLTNSVDHVAAAEGQLNDRVRKALYKRSAMLRILPPRYITEADLSSTEGIAKPYVIYEISSKNGLPPRPIRVMFDRIMTPKFTINRDDLRKHNDMNEIIDNLGMSIADELDDKFAHVTNLLMIEPGKEVPETGKVQWLSTNDTMSRNSLTQSVESAVRLFEPSIAMVGQPLAKRILSFNSAVVPDELPSEFKELGLTWCVVKQERFAPGALYFYGQHEKLGRTYVLQDAKAYLDVTAFEVSFYADMVVGAVVHDVAYAARVDFPQAATESQGS